MINWIDYELYDNSDGLWIRVRWLKKEFTLEEEQEALASFQKEQKRSTCEQEILARYPYYKQINMQNAVLEIVTLAKLENRDFTESELLVLAEAKEMKDFIDSKRLESNA